MKRWLLLTLLMLPLASTGQALRWASRYDAVRASDTLFIVQKGGKMGVADPSGRLLTKLDYDTIFNFREGVAMVGRGQPVRRRRSVNPFGKVLSDFNYGYLDKDGKEIVPIKFESINDFSEGLGLIEFPYGIDPYGEKDVVRYQFVDKRGRAVLELKHLYISLPFAGGLAYVETDHGFWLPPQVGEGYAKRPQLMDVNDDFIYGNYIDHTGKTLIPAHYDSIAPFTPGYLRPVRKAGKWGFLDTQAREAVPLRYDDVDADSLFFWGRLRRMGLGGRYGFMDDRTGRVVVPLRYTATLPSQRNVAWARLGGRWGAIDTSGRVVLSFRYVAARPFDAGGRAVASRQGHYGIVSASGREVSAFVYDSVGTFQEGRAVMQRAGRWGFLDTLGREVIPAEYDAVGPFRSGRAYAKRWGLFITLDPAGHWQAVKLQTATWRALRWMLLFIVLGYGLWRYRQKMLTNRLA